MAEETKPDAQVATPSAQVVEIPAQVPEEPFDKERAMATITKLREQEKEAKRIAKEFEQLKAEAKKREEAELSELERIRKQATELESHNAKLQADIWRRDAIAEAGLPSIFSDRIKGANKDEMIEDAKELAKLLPQLKQPAPHVSPTNPNGANPAETDQQKRERLFGRQSNLFDMEAIKANGGGVRFINK